MNNTWIKSSLSVAVLSLMTMNAQAEEPTQIEKESTQLKTIVVTSAGGYEQNIADAAATISVISKEELEKKSYSDVTDALKNVPGVFVQGGGTNQTISIRGMGSAYTLFLIDGKPMNDGSLLTTNGGVQGASVNFLPPIEAIERIEVIRGPSSSLYGSDAMGGVINIITKKHQDEVTGSIRTEYIKAGQSNDVNNDATNTSLYINAPLIDKLLSLQVTAGVQTIEESDYKESNNKEQNESDPEFDKRNLNAKLIYSLDDKNTITASFTDTRQERIHTPGVSIAEDNTRSHTVLDKLNYTLSHEGKYEKLILNSYLQYDKDKNMKAGGRSVVIDDNDTENPDDDISITNPGIIEFETLTLNTQGTYFIDKHALTLGATFKNENLQDGATNSMPGAAGRAASLERYQWSLFAEDTWNLSQDLAFTLSGRYDHNELFGENFSPKAYVVYHANNNWLVKGGVISGYKAPALRDSSPNYMLGSMGGAIMPNPDLKPETSWTYEAGLAFQDSGLGLQASLMIYQTNFNDKVTTSDRIEGSTVFDSAFYQDNPHLPFSTRGYRYKYNLDKAEIRGIELTTDYQINDYLKYRHSYTYTDSEQKTGANKGKPLNDLPKHMFNAGLDWDVNDQLSLWSQLNYRGKTVGNNQTPAYTFVDVGAVYNYSDAIQLSTGIYNVANKNVLDDGNDWVLDGRRYSFALNYKF